MIRTQIQLTEEQAKTLKQMSREQGKPIAELIRSSIDRYIRSDGPLVSDEERRRRAIALVGAFSSGVGDIAENHDKYLAEAYYDWQEKRATDGDIR